MLARTDASAGRRRARACQLAAALLIAAPGLVATRAAAQRASASHANASVSGVVRAATGIPLTSAAVLATDSTGTVVAGASTSDDGRFTLLLRRAGTYRVTVRRIGFAPDSATLRVRDDTHSTFDATLTPFALRLGDVVVADAKRCAISAQSGAAAVRMWQETQSALAATVAGEATPHAFTLEHFERELDPERGSVRRETRWRTIAATSEPYRSILADSLAAHGFVVPIGDSLEYYAPDARTLISDAFARGHCFRPVRDPAQPGLVGLAFAPAPSARGLRADVTGTLWLDAATAELRRLTFAFTPAQNARTEIEGSHSATATGEVVYSRAPDSTWIVDHWTIRMPVLSYRTVLTPESGTSLAQGTLVSRHTVASVSRVLETGGRVVDIASAVPSAPTVPNSGAVSGRFEDTTGTLTHSLSGIAITLESGGRVLRTAQTDSAGRFRIDGVAPGAYALRASGSVLDTLAASFPVRHFDIRPASELAFVATLPSRTESLALLCGAGTPKDMGAIHGVVRDAATGAPVAGATIRAAWFDLRGGGGGYVSARTSDRTAVSDSTGSYALCRLPLTRAFAVGARRGTLTGPVVDVPRRDEPLRFVTLLLGPSAPPR